jgi:hypothetical protein
LQRERPSGIFIVVVPFGTLPRIHEGTGTAPFFTILRWYRLCDVHAAKETLNDFAIS